MYITKSGKLLVSEIPINPDMIKVNGKNITIEGPATLPDMPLYLYLLKCGPVERVLFKDAGRGYVNPSLSCSGLTFGSTAIATGIIGYQVLSGNNLPTSLPIFVSPPFNNPKGQPPNLKTTIDSSGNFISLESPINNFLGYGLGFTKKVSPIISVNCGNQNNPPQLLTTIISGVITDVSVAPPYWTYCGNSYNSDTTINVSDISGHDAVLKLVLNGSYLGGVSVISGGYNYINPCYTLSPSGNNVNILPIIDSFIHHASLESSDYFYAPPDISINDNVFRQIRTHGNGAVAFPVMAGINDDDIVTYCDAVVKREEYIKPRMKAGFNLGEQPSNPYSDNFTAKNRYHQATPWQSSYGGNLNVEDDGTPIDWSNPTSVTLGRWILGPVISNTIDSYKLCSHTGRHTLKYKDPFINTPSGTYLRLGAGQNTSYVNLSGPNYGTTSGIQIDSRDINWQDGVIYSINLQHTNLGSGYTGALALTNNGSIILPIVEDGIITSLSMICPGYYNPNLQPEITIYGISVVNNVITQEIDIEYNEDYASNEIDLNLTLAQINGKFFLDKNIYISTPDPFTKKADYINLDKPLETQRGVIKSFTSPNGNTPDVVRGMDVTQTYSGFSNARKKTDFLSPSDTNWVTSKSVGTWFQQARFVNTDPANTGYAWYVNKIYGDLPFMKEGPDEYKRYFTLKPNDYGYFTASYGGGQMFIVELLSNTEHVFEAGDLISIWTNEPAAVVPITNGKPDYAPIYGSAAFGWPTSPSSIIVAVDTYQGNSSASASQINSNEVIPLSGNGWLLYMNIGNYNVPYEYMASLCSDLGETAYYCNLPHAPSIDWVIELVDRIDKYIGQDNPILLEYSNEIWNFGFASNWFMPVTTTIYGNLGYHFSNEFGGPTQLASDYYDIFTKRWKELGRDPSLVKRIFGSWMSGPGLTSQIVANCQQNGNPIDYIAVAPYHDITVVDTSNIVNYIGVPGLGSGWSPGAINDIFRLWMLNGNSYNSLFDTHQKIIDAWGQPTEQVAIWNVDYTGGDLITGGYQIGYTFEDAEGRETTQGTSTSVMGNVNSSYVFKLPLPSCPYWATKLNVYINIVYKSFADPQPDYVNQMILYSGIPTNSFNTGDILRISSWVPEKPYRNPPDINYASGYALNKPSLITYEGGAANMIPPMPFDNYIMHDCRADKSFADVVYDWYGACDQAGLEYGVYYQAYNGMLTHDMWTLALATSQIPGSGHDNRYALVDGYDHNGGPNPNKSTGLYGYLQWLDGLKKQSNPLDTFGRSMLEFSHENTKAGRKKTAG